jgi:hypothetical protein
VSPLPSRISAADYRTLGKAPAKASKFGNKRVTTPAGETFDSRREARRFAGLMIRARAGEIRNLRRQVRYPLTAHGVAICVYVGDFEYEEREGVRWELVTEDAKGFETPEFKLKAKMFAAEYGRAIRLT